VPTLDRPTEDVDEVCALVLRPSLLELPLTNSLLGLVPFLEFKAGNSDRARLCFRGRSGELFGWDALDLLDVVAARGRDVVGSSCLDDSRSWPRSEDVMKSK
jgi:hypothetical protein